MGLETGAGERERGRGKKRQEEGEGGRGRESARARAGLGGRAKVVGRSTTASISCMADSARPPRFLASLRLASRRSSASCSSASRQKLFSFFCLAASARSCFTLSTSACQREREVFRTISGVHLCWELEGPKGPKMPGQSRPPSSRCTTNTRERATQGKRQREGGGGGRARPARSVMTGLRRLISVMRLTLTSWSLLRSSISSSESPADPPATSTQPGRSERAARR